MADQTTIQRKNDLMSDIQKVRSQIEDSMMMGDSMFGRFAHVDVAREVTNRMKDLEQKKKSLEQDLKEKEALIQRANRDFSDVKDALPETIEQKRIRFIEDYTLLFVSLSYLFMVLTAILYYVMISEQKTMALVKGIGYTLVSTLFAGLILYFIA